jgi:mannosidase alpha-like ER degradation enhancer 2
MRKADRAAQVLFNRRSQLGLVGSTLEVSTAQWQGREMSIGPHVDSYMEYVLKV